MMNEPGIYDLSLAEYLADPAPVPSLSAGVANKLLTRSPWHAWSAHPRLGAPAQEYRRDAAIGTVFHALMLGKGGDYEVVGFDDFRTKAAKEARDEALATGKTPIKVADYDTAREMVTAAARQLAYHEIGDFTRRPGKAEQTVIWREGEVWCRAAVDWLPDDLEAEPCIYNLKTTTCGHPDTYTRRVFGTGYDLSAAHYIRGVQVVTGVEVSERFVVVENEPPYALSVIELSPGALHMAKKRWRAAVNLWGNCLARDLWPGYPARVCMIDMPAFLETQQTEREIAGKYDPEWLDVLLAMNAPEAA